MYKFFSRLKKKTKVMAATLSAGMLLWGGAAVAAPAPAEDGLTIFQEAYRLSVQEDNSLYTGVVDFSCPLFSGAVNIKGQNFQDDTFCWEGTVNWEYVEPGKNVPVKEAAPFYFELQKKEIALFAQRHNKWYKMTMPVNPQEMAEAVKKAKGEGIEETLATIKKVEITAQDNDTQTLLVTMDGAKVAAQMEKYCTMNQEKMTDQEKKNQQEFLQQITTTLSKMEIPVTWVVDRKSHVVLETEFDMTNILRTFVQQAMAAVPAKNKAMEKEEKDFVNAVVNNSSLKMTFNTLQPSKKRQISIPQKVRKEAEEVKLFQNDNGQKQPVAK